MSKENVAVVQAINDAWARGDFDAAFERMDTEVEWSAPPDVSGAGFERVMGYDGVRRSMANWLGAWDDYRFELRELTDFGDVVLVEGRQSGRGRGSGVEVSETIFMVWTVQAGKAVRQQMFRDRAQALEAARQ